MPKAGTVEQFADYLTDGYYDDLDMHPDLSAVHADHVIRVDLSAISAQAKQIARWAMDSWEAAADVTFREVRQDAEVTFSDSQPGPEVRYACSNDGKVKSMVLSVPSEYIYRHGPAIDQYAYQTYLHEIGHVLGLGHAGDYNGWASFDRAKFSNDSWMMSVMSYFSQAENPNVSQSQAGLLTPMPADIAAVQSIFGAPQDDRTAGDTIWGVGTTLQGALGDYFRAMETGSDPMISNSAISFLLRDAGGTDTVDFSHDDRPQVANLGAFIDIINPATQTQHAHVVIADGTSIENYVSGGGADRVIGTGADNTISLGRNDDHARGKGGNDRIDGDLGNDVLIGNRGNDRLWGGDGQDKIRGGGGRDRIDGGGGIDTIRGGGGNDRIEGGSGSDILAGQGGNDRIRGGEGLDRIDGGAGNDRIEGGIGADELIGGAGRDTFVIRQGTATDHVMDFEIGVDRLMIDEAILGGQTIGDVLGNPGEFEGETMLRFESGDRVVLHGLDAAALDEVDILVF